MSAGGAISPNRASGSRSSSPSRTPKTPVATMTCHKANRFSDIEFIAGRASYAFTSPSKQQLILLSLLSRRKSEEILPAPSNLYFDSLDADASKFAKAARGRML